MNKKKILSIFLSLSSSFLLFLLHEKSYAGIFGGYIPEGKEVKDAYLEQLFAPELTCGVRLEIAGHMLRLLDG